MGSHSVLGNSVSGLKIQLLKSVENGLQPGSSVGREAQTVAVAII